MRRSVLGTVRYSITALVLVACADAPTAPRAAVETPTPAPTLPADQVAASGTLVQLGTLSGFTNGGVYAINNAGETAGWNYVPGNAYHAFFRATNGAMTDLGTLGGTGSVGLAMNDSKAVVGLAYVAGGGAYHAFVSTVDATTGVRTMTDLGTLNDGLNSAAYGINTSGVIVGFSLNAAGKQRAVRWTPPNYVPTDLGILNGGSASFAYDVNDNGAIVGWSTAADGQIHAFKTSNTGTKMVALPLLPGGTTNTARAINNGGDVVGWANTATGVYHAWGVYAATGTAYDLGTQGGPSYAFDINDNQQAVGWCLPTTADHKALLWLQSTGSSDLGTASGTNSAQAQAINSKGQVVGLSGNLAVMWFVNANRLPTANPGTYTARTVNTAVTFDGSRSTDPDGDILTYAWTFGDGSTGTGVTPQHTYASAKTYTVALTVTDWRGGRSPSAQTTIVIR